MPSDKISLINEQKIEIIEEDYSDDDFAEAPLNNTRAINLTEFFSDEYGVATKNRTISGNVSQSNPFGFMSDSNSQHASY